MSGFDAGTTDDITIITAVAPPGTCTGEPSPDFDHTFDGMVGFLTNNDHIAVSNRSHASVGRAGRAARIGGTYWATW